MFSCYKSCFVPMCSNKTSRGPEKKFVSVPMNEEVRKQWFLKVRRHFLPGNKNTRFYCCIDHFHYPDDFENAVKHSLTDCKLIVKNNVYPHYFECQGRSACKKLKERSAVKKRERKEIVKAILNPSSSVEVTSSGTNINEVEVVGGPGMMDLAVSVSPSLSLTQNTASNLEHYAEKNWSRYKFYRDAGLSAHLKRKPNIVLYNFLSQKGRSLTTAQPRQSVLRKLQRQRVLDEVLQMTPSTSCEELSEGTEGTEEVGDIYTDICSPPIVQQLSTDKNIQVNMVLPFRSRYVQAFPSTMERGTSPLPLAAKVEVCTEMTPAKPQKLQSEREDSLSLCGSSWTETTSSLEVKSNFEAQKWNQLSLDVTLHPLNRRPITYLGLSSVGIKFVEKLVPSINCTQRDLYMTVQKLRHNYSTQCLGDVYGISKAQAGKVFRKILPELAGIMRPLIYWPKEEDILRLLPIAFRYKKVQSIIDCFEVPIKKPANPERQALSWSDYEHTNTVKYLVSCTPNGFINYVSRGYAGQTSDTALAEHCGFLDELKPGIHIMAVRGFKGLSASLAEKGITLVRPPSVQSGTRLEKSVAVQVKRIESLRIIIERAIGRIRNYKFLTSQNCVGSKQVPLLDIAVIAVAGLVNLQDPLL